MRIIIFNWRDIMNPEAGGAEVFTHEVALRWVKTGNDVTIITSRFQSSLREESLNGVKIIRTGGKYSVYRKTRNLFKKTFSKDKYDIVIDEINTKPFHTPKFIDDRKKIIALIHQLAREYWYYETPFPVSHIGYHFLEKMWLKGYVDIPTVTVSDSTKRDLTSIGFNNVFVVTVGLNVEPLEKLPKKEDAPTLIYIGRLRKVKFPEHALKVFKIVKSKLPNAKLWIIGEGYLKRELKSRATSGIEFYGRVSEKKKYDLLKRAHILLTPGLREGWGLCVTEANAMGTPAIAYNVPGLRDSVRNGETGILVPFDHIEEMAHNAIKILKDDEVRKKMAINALEYSRGFSWDTTAHEFMNYIHECI